MSSAGVKSKFVKLCLPGCMSFGDRNEGPEPKNITLLMKFVGVGIDKQSLIVCLLLTLNWGAFILTTLSLILNIKGATFALNMIFAYLLNVAVQIYLLIHRNSIAALIAQTKRGLSSTSQRKLVLFDRIASCMVLSLILSSLFIAIFQLFDSKKLKPGLILPKYSINILVWWALKIIHCVFHQIQSHSYCVAASIYGWIFFALHLQKVEEGEQLKDTVVAERKRSVNTLIALSRKHESFESTFSFLLFLISSFIFLMLANYVYYIIMLSPVKKWREILVQTCWMATDVLADLIFFGFVCRCQEILSGVFNDLFHLLCSAGNSQGEHVLLSKLIKSVYRQPVTIWRMLNVSRQLILAMFSSLLALSVLIMQIDNGSLKNKL